MISITKTLKLIFVLNVACLFASAISADAFAQPNYQDEISLGLSHVLKFNGVSEDLEMTPEQYEKLLGLWSEVEAKIGQSFSEYKDNFSPRFDEAKKEELKQQLKAQIEEAREFESSRIEETLLPHQVDRLKQISYQLSHRDRGGFGGIEEELKLSSSQKQQLKEIKKSSESNLRELSDTSRKEQLSKVEIREKLRELQQKTRDDALAVLDKDQRTKFDDLVGETFQFQTGKPKAKSD